MPKVDIGTRRYTEVRVNDEPGPGGACHHYEIVPSEEADLPVRNTQTDSDRTAPFCLIKFQEGPIKENSVNGIHNEDLIAIVIHRLRGFQSGKFACRQNAIALTKLEEALHWLNDRTQERVRRGVEGTSVI